ncbi:M28 family metallopeptidase [Glycocaulis sp.]|uniref:M28 family metallopeptidase n=1 Tax=Glycocaulis sp. TaxID=1969725 RepID=UPI0025B7FC42|nr:M28 family metallopeptidase [Glycocaulis sp.]MCH8521005.1 M28 family metallopeptidase [Glycocaulis sp.]
MLRFVTLAATAALLAACAEQAVEEEAFETSGMNGGADEAAGMIDEASEDTAEPEFVEEESDWPPVGDTSPEITEEDLHFRIRVLADDRFEGRAPGTESGERSAQWIADELARVGVQPGGVDGTWYQPVPLIEAILDEETSSLDISINGEPMGLMMGRDTVYWTENPEERVAISDTDLVFVGYGVVAPEYGWNDYEGIDVTGKTVVILVNDPGYAHPDAGRFNGEAMTYYGRWTYKFEEAGRQGAAGAIIVHQTEPASYGWDVVASSWRGPQFTLDMPPSDLVPVQGWVQLDVARRLFEATGHDFDALAEAAALPGFEPVALEGAQMSAELHTALDRLTSNNVIGLIEGSEAPDEYVLLMAHWDHLGVRLNFAADNDIYNGAVDNATGTAAIMEMGEAFALGEQPRRSVLVVAVTAEEQGLLGSAWFAANPTVPLSSIVGGLNIDAELPVGRTEDVVVVGYGASELEDILREEAAAQDRYLTPDPNPEAGYFYRSDHVSLARVGVPMIYAGGGSVHREYGREYVERAALAYRVNRYHQPADEYNPDWDLSGMEEDIRLLYAVARRLADSDEWPNWYEGNEFRGLRDAMMAGR